MNKPLNIFAACFTIVAISSIFLLCRGGSSIQKRNEEITNFGNTVVKAVSDGLKDKGLPLGEPKIYDVDGKRVIITIEIKKPAPKP